MMRIERKRRCALLPSHIPARHVRFHMHHLAFPRITGSAGRRASCASSIRARTRQATDPRSHHHPPVTLHFASSIIQLQLMSPRPRPRRAPARPQPSTSVVLTLLILLVHLSLVADGWRFGLNRPQPSSPSSSPRLLRGDLLAAAAASASSSSGGGGATATVSKGEGGAADSAGVVSVQQVFVCTNRWCMQRGAGATMGSFIGLTPYGSKMRVQGVDCLGRCNKGPNIRLLKSNGTFEELSYIDSVEKVREGGREGGRDGTG